MKKYPLYWRIGTFWSFTVKSRVLTRVTNLKIRFLHVLIYEMCFKTRCGSIVESVKEFWLTLFYWHFTFWIKSFFQKRRGKRLSPSVITFLTLLQNFPISLPYFYFIALWWDLTKVGYMYDIILIYHVFFSPFFGNT